MSTDRFDDSWLEVCGVKQHTLSVELGDAMRALEQAGVMPINEEARVAKISTAISSGSFVVSNERLELLRGLCQIYSAGIRADTISSHRRFVGPVIVFLKKALFRVISSLLGPSFRFQRDFNAGVIRLLGSLCNDSERGVR